MNEYFGSLKIAGAELRHIPHGWVRKALAVIPQDPLIFTGTLAFNLDPSQQVGRDELNDVVTRIGLLNVFLHLMTSISDGSILDYEVLNAGENLSQGQKQLICLGRAMLRKSKIILIDEATASLDDLTESIFYDVLGKHFTQSTILMICHKVDKAAIFCDKVIFGKSLYIIISIIINCNNFFYFSLKILELSQGSIVRFSSASEATFSRDSITT